MTSDMNGPSPEERRRLIAQAVAMARKLDAEGSLPPSLKGILLLDPGELWPLDSSGVIREAAGVSHEDSTSVLIHALHDTERRMQFVALSFFRDKVLSHLLPGSTETRNDAINAAIAHGMIRVGKVENPKAPDRPTSSISLNLEHPLVRDTLHLPDATGTPVIIRGEPLSTTIARERR